MKNPWMIPVAALVVGAAGGYITGQNVGETGASDASGENVPLVRSSARAGAAGADAGGSEEARRAARVRSFDEIQSIPGQSARIQALMDYYAGLSLGQLEDEARKLENLPIGERMLASFLLFGRWAEEDPMAAMAYSDTMGFAGAFVRPTILQSWASVDPANAARYYSENPTQFGMGRGGPMGQNGASSIAAEWARQDPDAALAWADSLQGREKNDALSAVVREVAAKDPAKAAEMAAAMDPDARGDAYQAIARQWGASNFSDAESWIRSLPADQQDAAMAEAIAGLSLENPELAGQKALSMPDGDEREDAISIAAGNWARTNPAEAANWVMGTGSEDAQRRAMRDIMPTWTAQNDAAALEFVTSQPAGDVRDSAAQAYVWSNRNGDPATVVRVAESITDDGDRMRTVGMAAARWMQQDPSAAGSYIQSSTAIPDRAKERLLSGEGWGWGGRRGRGR